MTSRLEWVQASQAIAASIEMIEFYMKIYHVKKRRKLLGFAETLQTRRIKAKRMQMSNSCCCYFDSAEPFRPFFIFSFLMTVMCDPEKNRGKIVKSLPYAYLLRSIKMITAPITTIAIIMPIVAGSIVESAVCPYGGAGVGEAGACGASSTVM